MKNVLFFLIVVIVFGCKQKGNEKSLVPDDMIINYNTKFDKILLGPDTPNEQITLDNEVVIDGGKIVLPVGTVLVKIRGNNNTLNYNLPDGYKIVGRGEDGKARAMAAGSITCNCSRGSGCAPFVASLGQNTTMGCAKKGSCTNCTMIYGSGRIGVDEESFSEVEVINFNNSLHFVTSIEESKSLVSPSNIIMELDEVRNQILSFAKGYQVDDLEALEKSTGPDDLPSTYMYLQVNVYGRVILLPVQKNLTMSTSPLVNELLRDGKGNARITVVYNCKCNKGSSGCKLNTGSLLLAKAIYCDAGSCTSCTLSWL